MLIKTSDFVAVGTKVSEPVDCWVAAGTHVDIVGLADAVLVATTVLKVVLAAPAVDTAPVADTVPQSDIAFGAAHEAGAELVAAEADNVLAEGTASLEAILPETEVEDVAELVVMTARQRMSATYAELDSAVAAVAGAAAAVAAVRPAVVTYETVVAMEVHPETSAAHVAAAVLPGN